MIRSLPLAVLTRKRRRTSELTRRRESKQPSPHHASYETRPRRSRPTICSARPLVSSECSAAFGTFRRWVEAKVVKKHFPTSIAESNSVDIDIADHREGYDEKKY